MASLSDDARVLLTDMPKVSSSIQSPASIAKFLCIALSDRACPPILCLLPEAPHPAVNFQIASLLHSGQISSVLEVYTIVLGLFIAPNIQSIVSLFAQRRLYSRGKARLRVSTWSISVIEGVMSPRILPRNYRALDVFKIASLIIYLEVLVVFQI